MTPHHMVGALCLTVTRFDGPCHFESPPGIHPSAQQLDVRVLV